MPLHLHHPVIVGEISGRFLRDALNTFTFRMEGLSGAATPENASVVGPDQLIATNPSHPHTRTRPRRKTRGVSSILFAVLASPARPRRQTLGNQIRHRNAKRPRNQNHLVIGHTAEKAFDLGDPRPADVKALELAFPGKVRLSPILFASDGADPCADDVLSAVVPHEPAGVSRPNANPDHTCEHFKPDFGCQSAYVPLGGRRTHFSRQSARSLNSCPVIK